MRIGCLPNNEPIGYKGLNSDESCRCDNNCKPSYKYFLSILLQATKVKDSYTFFQLMKNSSKLIVLSLALISASCSKSAKEDLDKAVSTHINAQTEEEGGNTCSVVFENALAKHYSGDSLCDELKNRTDAELFLCEDQIKDEKYQALIAKCKNTLKDKITELEVQRNEGLEVKEENLSTVQEKIPFQIQYRDVSHGYKAVMGDVGPKQVILTFDDGPSSANTMRVVNALDAMGVKGHFFLLGKATVANPKIAKQTADRGHSVANHSWDHPDFKKIGLAEQKSQLQRTFQAIKNAVGWADPFFRFPYGSETAAMKDHLAQQGVGNFFWSVDSNDWRKINPNGSVRTNLQVINDTMAQLDQRGRGLVLFHDIHQRTAELLPEFLNRLKRSGYTVVLLKPK